MRSRLLQASVAVPFVLFAIACGSSSTNSGFGDGTGPGSSGDNASGGGNNLGSSGNTPPPEGSSECQKMDFVFVVDDSGSMGEEQSNLASNFPSFVKVLDEYKTKSGAKLDYRIAVTTTGRDVAYTIKPPIAGFPPMNQSEKGDNGAFRNTKSCNVTRRWIERTDTKPADTFACLAKVGTKGPSVEMPLESLKLALNDRVADGTNAGFLRDDALLAVVILSDEDDCSRKDNNFEIEDDSCDKVAQVPVADYASMLDTVAKGKGRWATAVIAGAGPGKCTSSFGDAIEATRLRSFVGLAGKNGTFSSICEGDLTKSLKQALETFDGACKSFPGPK
ncbi:MAG: VWA domain-containing protein [Myxococcales bacterium]|jgi:hypothetical protein|nr:VWA domain-containing protein [Myxococcales bacterium]